MKPYITTFLLLCSLLLMSLFGCSKSQPGLITLDSADTGPPELVMKFEEISRTKNTSTARVTTEKESSVGSSFFIMRGFYEVAKARNFRYFTSLDVSQDDRGDSIIVAGFTNNKDADIKKEFGPQFSPKDQFGPKRLFSDTAELDKIFR